MDVLYDLAIIGGGITGASLAALAAENHYRTVLLEKTDFGAGVTSRSTRLIHGGLRYLEHGQLRVVREALRERDALLEDFPHQVKPLPFLVPIYQKDSRPAWWVRLGLEAYHLIGRSRLLARHRQLSPGDVLSIEPGLKREGLQAAFLYYDCQAVYPERLAVEMALTAEENGAAVHNHAPVTGLVQEGAAVAGVRVSGDREYRARFVVNAAGPWVDEVRSLLGNKAAAQRPLLTLISGAHIVTGPFPGAPTHAIYHEASADRRPFFVIPWRGLWLIGTTEIPYQGEPGSPAPAAAEIEYLLRETNLLFPDARLRRSSILYSYAGVRPLLYNPSGQAQAATRDYAIYDHENEEGVRGMITLAGGKLTTARALAAQTLERIAAKLGRSRPIRRRRPVWDANGIPARLAEIYGRRSAAILALARERPELGRPICDSSSVIAAEIAHGVTCEKARTLGDLLLRRTGLAFDPHPGSDCEAAAARIAAPLLGWEESAIKAAIADYHEELRRTLYRWEGA